MTTAPHRSDLLRTALWTVLALALLDAALGWVFRMPADPRRAPSALAQYFDFGRSIETKLDRLAGAADSLAAPVAHPGWLAPDALDPDSSLAPGQRRMTVFGQSFSYAIGESAAAAEPGLRFRARGGPSSPPSHLYAMWLVDRRRVHSDVAVLGVLASSVRGMDATTAATWMFESPYPYTYPRWRLSGDSLAGAWPRVQSLPALRATLHDPTALAAWQRDLATDDAWYDARLFSHRLADHSVLLRFLRRAWAQRQQRMHTALLHGPKGFREDAEAVAVLRRMVGRFARGVREDGGVPVVVVVNDRGYDDHLWRALERTLHDERVPFVSTHALAPATDAANFVADGHLVGAANRRIGEAVARAIRREDARRAWLTARAAPGVDPWVDPAAVAEALARWPLDGAAPDPR